MSTLRQLLDRAERWTNYAIEWSEERHRARNNEIDLCFRWLMSRRDYPYYRCDPPAVCPRVMRECVAEFCRSNPGFKL